MTWVKICGNTSLPDARLAIEHGADALGFVFAESRRRVTPAQVASITAQLPGKIERLGVFYSRDAAEIASVVEQAGLNAAQLHGGLDLGLIEQLRHRLGEEFGLIQTLHWVIGRENAEGLKKELASIAASGLVERVLVDSRVRAAGGGTGVTFDWKAARTVLREAPAGVRIIAAGGLRPENVGQAIRELEPWGVDVASGVESVPGQKDAARLRAFLEAAKQDGPR